MGRYRPPRPPSSKFITPQGAARLRDELDYLWKEKRPAVTKSVAEAAAQGDRSENAEYIYGKKQLAEIDRRVRHLRKRLDGMRVVDELPSDTSKIYFGAWFELEHDDGDRNRYRLVGPDEIELDSKYVSMDSPLGKAILGKKAGDELEVATPGGPTLYVVVNVRYESSTGKKKPDQRSGESQGETD
jgi:transcription elongation factor GreB